ncbi:MAG: hypothetical protein PHY57_09660 [Ignavibacterium sp.]|jgi:hypothetical protein|nr:hypothetical protein [Ignavibacterium sp.]MDX9713494.1 hypothetical protein [Ignavibacteriaceae bacterium]MEB2354366.1 hypothetical protein [Ignavibacteriales bacterium]GIK21703.1 MAG: hypothetical protein BroJett005_11170 [Ignavibacteriota bacterium]
MKKLYRQILILSAFALLFLVSSCNPFDDVYLNLDMDTEFNITAAGSEISIQKDFCLSDFEDYQDNKDHILEIRYISSAYLTINSTPGLQGNNLVLTLYQADGSTILFKYTVSTFIAADYINNPLKINLTQQEIDNINLYLKNPRDNKCFIAKLELSNVTASTLTYQLECKTEFLAELKIEP